MPKRKRAEDELEEILSRHQTEIFRMLKVAKGFERQRMAKRLRDPKSTPDKKVRIEREIAVLKSLDLQSVATAHLCASLLKIKAVAESPKLPESVKSGVPKPDISEEERAALHNVTSGLYNQSKVREALDRAIIDICVALRVPMPDKKGKQKRGDRNNDAEDTSDKTEAKSAKQAKQSKTKQPGDDSSSQETESAGLGEDEAEWNGFSDQDGAADDNDDDDSDDEEVDEKEQQALARFNDRLVNSDDEEYDTANEELDPMEITDVSASEDSDAENELDEPAFEDGESFSENSEVSDEEEASESELESESDSDSSALAPPPKARKATKTGTPGTTTTLPSLMGGYISGSESEASDIDVAPAARKNRRGQRARQAIWEKKFKEKAKHLEKEKSGRDSGWDLKRGAVDGAPKTPWKQGIKNPFGRRSATKDEDNANLVPLEPRKPKPQPPKKDNEGPLHPSWEARKKAKEQQATASFQGKRVVFD